MNTSARLSANALRDTKHILLRGLPQATTPQDLQRALMQANVKGVSDVALHYRHFRPTGKAILTLALPDYARDVVQRLETAPLFGDKVHAEPIQKPEAYGIDPPKSPQPNWELFAVGDGPSAGVSSGKAVSLFALPGKTSVEAVQGMVKDFKLAKSKTHPPIQIVQLPPKKFSLFSRFIVHLESESEAQRLVRRLHLTPFKNLEGAPLIKAEVIY